MEYMSIVWLLGVTLLLPVCLSHGTHSTVTSTTRRNAEQPHATASDDAEIVALNFLRRFTCFSHCQDIHSCLPEDVASAVSKGDGSVNVSTLLDHVLHMRSDCQRANTLPCDFGAKNCARLVGYLATDGDVSFNELESFVNYALLYLKRSYQPVQQETCFTAHDLFYDMNDAPTSGEQKVESLKSAMFARLSAGECIERVDSNEFIIDIFGRYNNSGNSSLTESGLNQLMSELGIVRHFHDEHDHDDHSHDDHNHDDHNHDDHDHHDHDHHDHNKHIQLQKQNNNKFLYTTSMKTISNTEVDVDFQSHQSFPSTESHTHAHPHHDHKRSILEETNSNSSSLNLSSCWDAGQLLKNFDMDNTGDISIEEFSALCPALIQQRLHGSCLDKSVKKGINTAEIYGYGTLSVFIISLCSVLGVILMPIQNTSFYEYLIILFDYFV